MIQFCIILIALSFWVRMLLFFLVGTECGSETARKVPNCLQKDACFFSLKAF